ncbi:origin of replication complex subunit 3 [Phragmites australis]|uniref:origin of replication complex subunit 3 n=1 Tax=Phragmites australis TaxID=29695 RepID=UPI002D77FE74|nr:origin of replication complex subunit 3 [Phragmites australis]
MAAPPCDAPLTAANNIQPFFVLHKAATASSAPSSRARRRIDASQSSSPNAKSAKRSRDVEAEDEEDEELYEQLRLEAFHRTWSKIQSTIDEVLRGINLKLFDEVLQWVQESFSAVRAIAEPCHDEVQQPHPLLTDVICRRIPTAFVLTKNAEFVDDVTTFRDLAEHLESNGCHLAKLSAAELSAKHGVGGCFRNLLRQLLSDVPDVADVSALASWYCGTENHDQPIIIVIDDLEQCSGDVLGELVMMLSEWVIKIPIFFVMAIATTLDAPRKLLSSEALQRLEPCKLTLGSPSDRMNALVEAILVKPCAGFCISHEVAVFLRNYFFRHDGTITSFISALKLACSKHFSMEPLSFMCMGMLEADCKEFWRDKFETLPQVMRKYAFGLPSCTSGKNASNFSNNLVEGLSELLKLQKDWSSVLLCLYEAGRHDKVQLLDIFCEAVNSNLQTQSASNGDLFISKETSENLSGVKLGSDKGYIAQAMNTIRYLPMETLLRVLEVWSIHLKGMSEISDKVKELQSTTISADSVRTTQKKWTRRSTCSIGNGTVPLNDKAVVLLHDVTRKYLVPVECLPFHELICFKNVGILQSALIGNPRRMVQLDLLKSQSHLKCSCCSRSGTAVSGSLHDTSIMCNLAQEYGDVINVHDWYITFEGIVNSTNSKVKRKSYSSPSKKKSKSTLPEGEAMIQARFCRAVTEMQITGLLRMPSKRRPDLVQRIAFGP